MMKEAETARSFYVNSKSYLGMANEIGINFPTKTSYYREGFIKINHLSRVQGHQLSRYMNYLCLQNGCTIKSFLSLKNGLILRTTQDEEIEKVPIWVMRQAGRYLPH